MNKADGLWLISGAEIAEILGLGWKEFLEWSREGLPSADAVSLAETSSWYLWTIRRKYPDTPLVLELERRYGGRVRKIAVRNMWEVNQIDPRYSGHLISATELVEMFGVSWREFEKMVVRSDFPIADRNRTDRVSGMQWWATTLVLSFPGSLVHKCLESRYLVDPGPIEDNG
jgi:hypothetical protein